MPASAHAQRPPSLRKTLKEGRDWLQLARKIHRYRRDVLTEQELSELEKAIEEFQSAIKQARQEIKPLLQAIEQIEPILRRVGGTYYPNRFWSENIEMLLVAAILALGIRTFFLQPFKIPTNSMYPTYHGMTYELAEEDGPGTPFLLNAFRTVTFEGSPYEAKAPTSGMVRIPFFRDNEPRTVNSHIRGRAVSGRRFLILPAARAEYQILVDNEPVTITVPLEFNFGKMMNEWIAGLREKGLEPRVEFDPGFGPVLVTGHRVEAGETFLEFNILTGDALFVDRMSYHFIKPKVGNPFVFRTRDIPDIEPVNADKYYIKRLVGEGGDTLRIEPPILYRNDEPITGAEAFAWNAEPMPKASYPRGEYEGYTDAGNFMARGSITLPENTFFAMGDNSDESSDSRYWGFVPKEQVIGRAIFIYHPFTSRWGPAK